MIINVGLTLLSAVLQHKKCIAILSFSNVTAGNMKEKF
jgi:hypothetical protein